MSCCWLLLAALEAGAPLAREPAARSELVWRPLLIQNVITFSSPHVTAGGVGGGGGIQLEYHGRYLAQADVSLLFSAGNALATRFALGLTRGGTWAPAGWLSYGALWGDRLEFIAGNEGRPVIPTWAVGVRGSALRFRQDFGVVSLLELGAGSNFAGGVWLDVTILQAAVTF